VTSAEKWDTIGFPHVFVPGTGSKTLLLLHGTGGDENSLLSLARQVGGDASLLGVRGKILENGMPRFFRRFAEGVFDIEDIKFRAGELAEFVAAASARYGFSGDRVVTLGYSNGGNMGAALLLLRPEASRYAILFRAMLPLRPESLPDLSHKGVFISAGRNDTMIPGEGTLALESILVSAGARVTTNWEPADHRLTPSDVSRARDWLSEQSD
jgi:predicted esterase